MKIVFLGTNGWYDTETGNSICTLIETKDCYIILDAGNGIHKADRHISRDKPVFLFLSHFHLDHIIGLHILAKFRFKSLTILGQPGTKKILADFLSKKYSVPLSKLHFKTKIIDIHQGWYERPFRFQCLKLVHASPCFGYRFEIGNKVISYCIDTGYCQNAVKLAKKADLLISECSFFGKIDPNWPHLNPEFSAKLAMESGAKKLLMTHFDANVYRTISKRKKSEKIARNIFNNSIAAMDDMEINI